MVTDAELLKQAKILLDLAQPKSDNGVVRDAWDGWQLQWFKDYAKREEERQGEA